MPDSNSTIEKSLSNSNRPLIGWFHRHQEILWWLHSLYALILGIEMMWLGGRKFAYLRIAIFYISFIWLSSLFLPKLLSHPPLPARWAPGLQLPINFFNKICYHQLLF